MQKTLERILWVLGILGLAAGAYGLFLRFTDGHQIADYGSYVPWGLWIAAYIFLIGASAGSVGVAAVLFMTKRDEYYPLARLAMLVALVTFVGAMLNVWLDLGHPFRMWKLYFQTSWTSVMGWMSWFYAFYGILLAVGLLLTRNGKIPPFMVRFAFLVFLFAIAFAGAEGALFGVVGARAVWESGLTPLLFLVEGALFGLGFVAAAAYVRGYLSPQRASLFGGILLVLLGVLVVIEWAEYSTGLYAAVPAKSNTLLNILTGDYWWVFWIFHVAMGIVLPALLLLFARSKPFAVASAGALVGIMGLASKLNLVIPALAQEELQGLSNAFHGPGLRFTYFPTTAEWLVFGFTVSLVLVMFLVGAKILHIARASEVA